MQLAQQAQASLGQSDVVMLTERGDAVALRIGQMVPMGVPEVLDRHIPRHGTQRGRSWGGTAVLWLASLVTEGDHRNGSVATARTGLPQTLRHVPAQVVEPLDGREDRLRPRRQHVRTPTDGPQSAGDGHARSLEVHALPQDVRRGEATTVSGAHAVPAEGLWPCGQKKEEPTRPQSTVRLGSLDPWGMPLSTEVVAGARADDGFDLPSLERSRSGLPTPGLWCVGDGKRRALATRASLARPPDWSWSPGPWTGATAAAMDAWGTAGGTPREAGE